jgi:hypothetical protein
MLRKEHYNKDILLKIINLSYNMNPLSKNNEKRMEILRYLNKSEIELCINDIDILYKKLINKELKNHPINELNMNFIQGLFEGDGSISIYYPKSNQIRLTFSIVQDIYNIELLKELEIYFNCGKIYNITDKAIRYDIKSIKEIKEKVIPQFNNIIKTLKLEKLNKVNQILEL